MRSGGPRPPTLSCHTVDMQIKFKFKYLRNIIVILLTSYFVKRDIHTNSHDLPYIRTCIRIACCRSSYTFSFPLLA